MTVPTRWAILSDIHGNLEALEAVLADAEEQRVDKIAVLGDTIDYGPDPVACLDRVAAVAQVALVGNHEGYAVAHDEDAEDSDILRWSAPLLATSETWHRIRDKIAGDGPDRHASHLVESEPVAIHFVHASAGSPTKQYLWPGHEIQYVIFNRQIDERITEFLDQFIAPHGFNGHTHVPAVLTRHKFHGVFDAYHGVDRHHVHTFVGPNSIFFVPRAPCVIREVGAAEMAVNVGSVGQPRRLGDNRASYVVYDGDTLEFRRVAYPWMTTAAKLAKLSIDAEQQKELIERLETGV